MPIHFYHVTTLNKLRKYLDKKQIKPPVRAWKSIESAERFSKQTGRKIIIRVIDNGNFVPLEGHKGNAVYSPFPLSINNLEL